MILTTAAHSAARSLDERDDRNGRRVEQRAAPELHGILVFANANAIRRDADQSDDRGDRRRPGLSDPRRVCSERGAPDIVDVFRKPSEVGRRSPRRHRRATRGRFGFSTASSMRKRSALADAAGIGRRRGSLHQGGVSRASRGGLSTGGLNSGVISSRRRAL